MRLLYILLFNFLVTSSLYSFNNYSLATAAAPTSYNISLPGSTACTDAIPEIGSYSVVHTNSRISDYNSQCLLLANVADNLDFVDIELRKYYDLVSHNPCIPWGTRKTTRVTYHLEMYCVFEQAPCAPNETRNTTTGICEEDCTAPTDRSLLLGITSFNCETNNYLVDNGKTYNNLKIECDDNCYGDLTDSNAPGDADGDGIPDAEDDDIDGDGILNNADSDMDGDGILNGDDPNPQSGDNCPALGTNVSTAPSIPHLECTKSNPLTIVPDRYTYYLSSVDYDNCRELCTSTRTNCPRGQSTINGICIEPQTDITQCNGEVEPQAIQYVIFVGNADGKVSGCTKDFFCLDGSNNGKGYLLESIYVSCQDENEEEPDSTNVTDDDKNDTNTTSPIDPLLDSNGTVNSDTAKSFKAALESYAASKESTQKEMDKELKKHTSLLEEDKVAQKNILEQLKGIKETGESAKASRRKDSLTTNNLLTDLKNTSNKESTQQDILTKLDSMLNSTLSKQDITDAMNDASLDVNVTVTGDTNSSTTQTPDTNTTTPDTNTSGDGWTQQDLKDSITDQLETSYTIFDVSNCGSPSFSASIVFMDYITVENPLPIMHEHTQQYYDAIKILIIIGATLAGFLTIFRR